MAKRTIPPEPSSAQEKLSTFRKLKVRESYYDHQYHPKPHAKISKPPVPVPWVQIKGYWLNQAGFTIGSQLSVEVKEGCIILKTKILPAKH